jgi:pimeloyl-ACP methyl ester carboxylesterase
LPTSADEARIGEVAFFTGAGGVRLAARLAGPPEGPPIVLVHGFSQGSLVFANQLTGRLARRFRLIAPDLRGHGMSETGDLSAMADGPTWGADLAACLDAFASRPAVLVGWSYGGRLLCEFVRREGERRVAGLVFVSAVTQSVLSDGSRPVGEGAAALADMMEDDDAAQFAAISRFLNASTARPLPPSVRERLVAMNAAVRPSVRRAMQRLVSDNDALLASLTRPVLVIHGEEDRVVRRESAQNIVAQKPDATLRLLADVGHAPFLEAAEIFEDILASFTET